MKRLLMALFFLSLSINLFAQSTPVSDLRVATATTTFGINLPIGTKVYNIADGKYWVATAGVISTATLTTASTSFTQLNAATDISTKKDKSDSTASDGYVRRDRLTSSLLLKEDKSNKVTSFSTPTDTQYPSAKLVSDQLDLHKDKSDSTATDGYVRRDRLTSSLATKAASNASLTLGSTSMALGSTTTTVAGLTSVTSTTFVGNLTGNASGTAANVTGTVVVANGGTGLTTITSGSYMIGNGTGNVTVKTPAQVLTDIGAAAAANASLFKVEAFSEATTGATGTSHTLANTPKASTAIQVILNGTPLLASQYTYTSATPAVQITIPVYQYDAVTISYGY